MSKEPKVGCPLVGSHSSSRQGGHRGILVGLGCPGKSLLQIAPLTPALALTTPPRAKGIGAGSANFFFLGPLST